MLFLLACTTQNPVLDSDNYQVSIESHLNSNTPSQPGFLATRSQAFEDLSMNNAQDLETLFGGAVADIDQDGWLDVIYAEGPSEELSLFFGTGEVGDPFEKRHGTGLWLDADGPMFTIATCDLDGDGQDEVILPGMQRFSAIRFDSRDEWQYVETGIETPTMTATPHISCHDFDNDGDLDLLLGHMGQLPETQTTSTNPVTPSSDGVPNTLWWNDGTGRFTQATDHPLLTSYGVSLHFRYWRESGHTYLFESIDFVTDPRGPESTNAALFTQPAGSDWKEWFLSKNTDTPMGSAVVYWTGEPMLIISADSVPDMEELFMVGDHAETISVSPSTLGCFSDSYESGMSGISWSVLNVDPYGDQGSPQDVLLAVGDHIGDGHGGSAVSADQRSKLYLEEDCSTSQYELIDGEPSERISRGVGVGDFNRDGVQDMVFFNLNAPPHLMFGNRNLASRLVIVLQDEASKNSSGHGALVSVETPDGDVSYQTLDPYGNGGFGASSKELFFGLGDHDTVSKITISLPDGRQVEIDEDIPADARVTITLQ